MADARHLTSLRGIIQGYAPMVTQGKSRPGLGQ